MKVDFGPLERTSKRKVRVSLTFWGGFVNATSPAHVDPASKSFALSQEGVTRSLERAREEARKCVLPCANCHAEVEAGVRVLEAPRGGFEPPRTD